MLGEYLEYFYIKLSQPQYLNMLKLDILMELATQTNSITIMKQLLACAKYKQKAL